MTRIECPKSREWRGSSSNRDSRLCTRDAVVVIKCHIDDFDRIPKPDLLRPQEKWRGWGLTSGRSGTLLRASPSSISSSCFSLLARAGAICIAAGSARPHSRVSCVLTTFQPSRYPSTGWHRRRRRNDTAKQYYYLCQAETCGNTMHA